jgi:hypothetical protein
MKMHSENLLKIPFSMIGQYSLVHIPYWLRGKCARINLSQAASSMILHNHRRLPRSIFHCQNLRYKVFESGYWKDF